MFALPLLHYLQHSACACVCVGGGFRFFTILFAWHQPVNKIYIPSITHMYVHYTHLCRLHGAAWRYVINVTMDDDADDDDKSRQESTFNVLPTLLTLSNRFIFLGRQYLYICGVYVSAFGNQRTTLVIPVAPHGPVCIN